MESCRKMPDPAVCRTKLFCGDNYNCLTEQKYLWSCPYVFSLGYDYFCRNPECANFAIDDEETDKEAAKCIDKP